MDLLQLFTVLGIVSGLVALVLSIIALKANNRLSGRIMDIQQAESSRVDDFVSDLRSTNERLFRILENQLPRPGGV